MILFIIIVDALIFGFLCEDLANAKGYGNKYFFLGFLLSIFELLYVIGLPDRSMYEAYDYALTQFKNEFVELRKEVAHLSNKISYSDKASVDMSYQNAQPMKQAYDGRWKCQKCGLPNDSSHLFCSRCGTRAPSE